jgi:hypothetical protein
LTLSTCMYSTGIRSHCIDGMYVCWKFCQRSLCELGVVEEFVVFGGLEMESVANITKVF